MKNLQDELGTKVGMNKLVEVTDLARKIELLGYGD